MKEYLFNHPKFQEGQVVSFRGQICLILLASQMADIVNINTHVVYTDFQYVLCDYWTHHDVTMSGATRYVPEKEVSELTEDQRTQLVLTAL